MTSDVKSRARVRWAKPEDYAAVVGIHEFVYDGGDYLPVMYHVFLQRKEADCFVLEVDGEIVRILRHQLITWIISLVLSWSIKVVEVESLYNLSVQ